MQLKQIKVNGVDLAFVEAGTGETVLFVHGANGDWRTWDSLRPYIAQKYHHVAFSRRYHQPNPWRGHGADYSTALHVQDLAALIRALDVGKVHLVGGSYGGWIATYVALEHPDLVLSLVLSEPALINDDTPEAKAAIADWNDSVLAPIRQALQEGDTRKASVILWNGVNDERFSFEKMPLERQERWLTNANTLPLWMNAAPLHPLTCETLLKLRMPVLLMRGEYARPYFRQSNDRLIQCLPVGTSTVVVPNAPHVWYPVNPKAGADAILAFLSKL
jgi:non-heme chloroperoxidase